jgi:hypothetical protein
MSDRPRDVDVAGAAARLVEVAAEGEPVEVILVVRGTLRPIDGSAGTRWRMRLDGDRVHLGGKAVTVWSGHLHAPPPPN